MLFAVVISHMGGKDTPAELQYPSPDGSNYVRNSHWHAYERPEKAPKCLYKQFAGECRVLSVQYNSSDWDRMEVVAAFVPQTVRRGAKPLELVRLMPNDDWLTQDEVEDLRLFQGASVRCIRKELRVSEEGCPHEDWLFPELHWREREPAAEKK